MKIKQSLFILSAIILTIIIIFFSSSVIENVSFYEKMLEQNNSANKLLEIDSIYVYDIKNETQKIIDIKSEKVFLHFWATWCKPCIEEFQTFDSLLYKNESFSYYFISQETTTKVKEFVSSKNYKNIPFYTINEDMLPFDLDVIPFTIIKNKEGSIEMMTGKKNWKAFFENQKHHTVKND